MSLSNLFIILRFQLRQAMMKQFYTNFRSIIAKCFVYSGIIIRLLGGGRVGLALLLKGRRVANVNIANIILRKLIKKGRANRSLFVELLGNGPGHPLDFYEGRSLILKIPVIQGDKLIEKGVLIFKFSDTFSRMYLSLDVDLLSKYFQLVLEPSSSGYSAEEILAWTTITPKKLIVFTPDEDDYQFLSNLGANLVPMKLGAADWVNPGIFYKIDNVEKKYDSLYIASFNPIKRVDRYIRALVKINKSTSDHHAALVCAGVGSSQREIMAMLDWAGDKANITFFNGMPQSELNELLNQSKVNILLSLKEGANKGLSEGLNSGTPAILLDENIGVKRTSINEKTGKIIRDSELEETLIWFSEHYTEFKPHEWAMTHISPSVSTHALSEKIKEIEISEGRQWTSGLFIKVNSPELAYLDPECSWLLSKRAELLNNFSHNIDEKNIIEFLQQLQETTIK